MTSRFECPRCQTVFTRDKGDDEAYVECPSCGAMAMHVGEATDALARHFSAGHDVGGLQENTTESLLDDDEDSGMVHRPEPSLVNDFGGGTGGAGIFSGLLTVPDKNEAPPPPVGGLDLGLDDELADFHLPAATTPGNPALSPQKKTVGAKKLPAAPVPKLPPDLPPSDVKISLGDDALDALGAAFDSMAARPSQQRGADGLSDDERNFLNADAPRKAPAAEAPPMPPRRPPPRPPGKPGERRQPPPPRTKKASGTRKPSTGIALSAEAKEAAFLPLKVASSPPVSAQAPETAVRPRATRVVDNEATAVAPAPVAAEPTTVVARPSKVAPREKPTVLGGVSKLAMAAAVVVGLLGGSAIGAATAPAPVKRNDARGRAEQQLADGNRYYQVGRFNDAIAAYKAALSLDRAYAVAHRAKGAALANAQRYDEAAEAYRDYLALEPQAIDAADIKEALNRRGVAPVAGGTGGQ